jgi:hypothetical protein
LVGIDTSDNVSCVKKAKHGAIPDSNQERASEGKNFFTPKNNVSKHFWKENSLPAILCLDTRFFS